MEPLQEDEVKEIIALTNQMDEIFLHKSETVIINVLLNSVVRFITYFNIPIELVINGLVECASLSRAVKAGKVEVSEEEVNKHKLN